MKTNKRLNWLAGLLLVVATLVTGCSKGGAQADARAFAKASPEIKADWERAVAADKANDYFAASTAYARIVRQETQLTPAQFQTALEASRLLAQRMSAAAEQGDGAAREAMRKLMSAQSQR
jgi:hypothetical protein